LVDAISIDPQVFEAQVARHAKRILDGSWETVDVVAVKTSPKIAQGSITLTSCISSIY
jgi:hypothetical protein